MFRKVRNTGVPMPILVGYLAALIVFGIVDAIWLSVMGNRLYRPTLGDILLPNLRLAPAIVFYLTFPVGIVVFAAAPAIKSSTLSSALTYGSLFGAVAYATYDLTNFATLRNWTLQLTMIDIIYGAVTTALSAFAATLVMRQFAV
jgi:uncharacterized membrane protein